MLEAMAEFGQAPTPLRSQVGAMLITRALVGIVGAILALIVVYTGGIPLLIALIVLSILGLHEFYRMTRSYRPNLLAGYGGAVLILIGAHTGGLEGALRGCDLPVRADLYPACDTRAQA